MGRPYLLSEATWKQLREERPQLAILPWGATEAHGDHLPYTTDVIEAQVLAERSAAIAHQRGAKLVVLPAIPFGNNAQQLDQSATIHLQTTTAHAILSDVAHSLKQQGITRLLILNAHGGNEFKPLIRDLSAEAGIFIVQVNFFQMLPAILRSTFAEPGDHAGEMETSMLMHICPELVQFENAGQGSSIPFDVPELSQPGVWTPRPWSRCHPDGCAGNPGQATPEKGRAYTDALCQAIANLLHALATAPRVP